MNRTASQEKSLWQGSLVLVTVAAALALAVFLEFDDVRSGSPYGVGFWISTLFYIIGLACHFRLGVIKKQVSPLWPGVLFPVAFSLFHFGTLGLYPWFESELFDYAWQVSVLCGLAWLTGYSLALGNARINSSAIFVRRHLEVEPGFLQRLSLVSLLVFLAGLGAQFVFFVDYGIVEFFGRAYGKEALTPTGGNPTVYLYSIGGILCVVSIVSMTLSSVVRTGRVFPSRVALFLVGIYLLTRFVEGDRGALTMALLPPLFIRHYWGKRFNWRHAVLILLLALVIFTGLKSFRGSKQVSDLAHWADDLRSVSNVVVEMGSTLDTVIRSMTLVPSRYDYFLGRTYLWAIARSIPNMRFQPREWGFVSSVWITKETAPETYQRHGGLGFSVVAEAFINLGPLGSCLILFLLGSITARLERLLAGVAVNLWHAAWFVVFLIVLLEHVRNTAVVLIRGFMWMSWVLLAIFLLTYLSGKLDRIRRRHQYGATFRS